MRAQVGDGARQWLEIDRFGLLPGERRDLLDALAEVVDLPGVGDRRESLVDGCEVDAALSDIGGELVDRPSQCVEAVVLRAGIGGGDEFVEARVERSEIRAAVGDVRAEVGDGGGQRREVDG